MSPPPRRPRTAAVLALALADDAENVDPAGPIIPTALLASGASRRSILMVMRALDRRAEAEAERRRVAADLARDLEGVGV